MKRYLLIYCFLFLAWHAIGQNRELNIGDTLPNFSYQGQFSKSYNLNELKGSYVLVNFWATWNLESRGMQLDFIDIYAKYKDKRFKKGRKFYILSISLDEAFEVYNSALKKDNLPWKSHLCDFKGWSSPIIQQCGVQSIPFNYLLDPNGIVIAKNIKKDLLEDILRAH